MADLYKNIEVLKTTKPKEAVAQQAYRGISTVNPNNNTFQAFDLSLIKQDLLNHFHIRQGEKLENPTFGTIIWDALYEPLTDELKEAIATNVTNIVNYDPRTRANKIVVDSYEHGLQIECSLTYVPYNISEVLKLQFDKENGLIS
tara:strand:+ start:63 stop:497 length:435 start_codon:yes stop_codon:yes gene_type:complete